MKIAINIGVGTGSLVKWKDAVKANSVEAGRAFDAELDQFDDYLESQGMSPVGKVEHQILTEYLGWKLMNTGG